MKTVRNLLKLSLITMASSIVITNPIVQSVIGIDFALASEDELPFIVRNGDGKTIIKCVVDNNIMHSNAEWAKEAINGKGESKWTESINNLKKLIFLYRHYEYFEGEDEGEKSAQMYHKKRMEKFSESVTRLLTEETSEQKNMDITSWQKTDVGRKVFGLINGMMVSEALYLCYDLIKRCAAKKHCIFENYWTFENWSFAEISKWMNGYDRFVNESLYDIVYRNLTGVKFSRLSHCKVSSPGYLKESLNELLGHFKGGAEAEDVSSLYYNLRALKEYLEHDFNCYLQQFGIICDISVCGKEDNVVEPSALTAVESIDRIVPGSFSDASSNERRSVIEKEFESRVKPVLAAIDGLQYSHGFFKVGMRWWTYKEQRDRLIRMFRWYGYRIAGETLIEIADDETFRDTLNKTTHFFENDLINAISCNNKSGRIDTERALDHLSCVPSELQRYPGAEKQEGDDIKSEVDRINAILNDKLHEEDLEYYVQNKRKELLNSISQAEGYKRDVYINFYNNFIDTRKDWWVCHQEPGESFNNIDKYFEELKKDEEFKKQVRTFIWKPAVDKIFFNKISPILKSDECRKMFVESVKSVDGYWQEEEKIKNKTADASAFVDSMMKTEQVKKLIDDFVDGDKFACLEEKIRSHGVEIKDAIQFYRCIRRYFGLLVDVKDYNWSGQLRSKEPEEYRRIWDDVYEFFETVVPSIVSEYEKYVYLIDDDREKLYTKVEYQDVYGIAMRILRLKEKCTNTDAFGEVRNNFNSYKEVFIALIKEKIKKLGLIKDDNDKL